MAKMTGAKKAEFLRRMAAGRKAAKSKKAGRYAGGMVRGSARGAANVQASRKPRKGARKRRAGSTAMVKAPAVLPARKGHPRGKIGAGTPAVRLSRVEHAVMDLARAQGAVVSKIVEHERRLNSVENTLSTWAKGRR